MDSERLGKKERRSSEPDQIKADRLYRDTQGARGPTNFHGRKGRRLPKEGSEKKLEITKNFITASAGREVYGLGRVAACRHRKEGVALYDQARSHEGTTERRHTSVASKHEGAWGER